MRTTLEIDEKLLEEVVALTGERSKGKAVSKALEEYIRRTRIEHLIQLSGKIDIEPDWRKLRDGELGEER